MSRHHKGEANPQDLSDIEEGKIKANCFNCGAKQNVHTKHMTLENIHGEIAVLKTKNQIGVCTNPQCYRYSNPANIPSWVPEKKVIRA